MSRIPRVVHFVFGFRPQTEPFHLVHAIAIESCRRLLEPEAILVHCHELPFGTYWDVVRPHVTLVRVGRVPMVDEVAGGTDERYRYAHHADAVRLDALVEYGGIYADIDTVFVRPFPDELFDASFVLGREGTIDHPTIGRANLVCNALMLAEPGAPFAVEWRARLAAAYDGSWAAHSNELATRMADEDPGAVRVEPETSFHPAPPTVAGIRSLLEDDSLDVSRSYSVHLWAHLWWDAARTDFTTVQAATVDAAYVEHASTSYARLARPFLPRPEVWRGRSGPFGYNPS